MPEHRGEKPAIVFLLRQALPFVVCRDPGTLVLPAMLVGEHLRAYLPRSELPHDRERYRPAELIQRPMREFRATGGSYSTRAELKVISGRASSVEELHRILATTGPDPARWLPVFCR